MAVIADFAAREGLERPQNHKGLVNTITRKLVIQTIQKERQTHLKTFIESAKFQRTWQLLALSFASTTVTDLALGINSKQYFKRSEAVPHIRHKLAICGG